MKETHLFLILKTSHVSENGAPPALYLVLHIEFNGFNSRIEVSQLAHFSYRYNLTFLERVWSLLNVQIVPVCVVFICLKCITWFL